MMIDRNQTTMGLFEGTQPLVTTSMFNEGNLKVQQIKLNTSHASKPPSPLFILSPVQEDTYPILVFVHGFCILDTCYTSLFKHISSHGFILVAIGDQLDLTGLLKCCFANDVIKAASVADWLSTGGLNSVLPDNVIPDLENVAIAGHSKGGKTAFALALGQAETTLKLKALIGVDPVAGFSISFRTQPKILTYIPRSFLQKIPVAVIGMGLSHEAKGCFPPFAPYGCNHSEFYNESDPPVSYFLAKGYGHCDMLDEFPALLASLVAQSGKGSKELLRKCVGGIIVAFLEAKLKNDSEDLNAILEDPYIAPTELDPVIYVPE